jgi:hypothetical protein
MNILTLAAALKLDGTGFKAGLKEAEVSASKFGNRVAKDVGGKLSNAFAIGTLAFGAKSLIDYNSTIKDTAEAMGISIQAFQEQSYWITQNGGEVSDLKAAYIGLSKARRTALEGDAGKQDIFSALGINMDDLRKMPIEDIFKRAAESFRTIDFGNDKIAAVMEIFGKAGTSVIPALEQSISDAADEAERLGQVISTGTVEALEELGDKWDQTGGRIINGLSETLLYFVRAIDFAATTALQGIIGLAQQAVRASDLALTALSAVPGTGAGFPALQAILREADTTLEMTSEDLFNKMLDRYDINDGGKRRSRKFEGDLFTDDEAAMKQPKEPKEARAAREAEDRGEPGRANEVASLTRTGQLSARDATLTARAPIERAVEYMRQQLDVEKQQLQSLRAIETKKGETIQGHF